MAESSEIEAARLEVEKARLEIEKRRLQIEARRSAVRVWVTYAAIGVYLLMALGGAAWLMALNKTDLAVSVLGGVASTAGAITGFWFGARRSGSDGPQTAASGEGRTPE